MKNKLSIIFVTLLTLGAVFFLFAYERPNVISEDSNEPEATITDLLAEFSVPTINSVELNEQTNYYTIEGSYPDTPYPIVQAYIDKTISEFKQTAYNDLGGISNQEKEIMGWIGDRQYNLHLYYETYTQDDILSIIIYENTYTLGAHGNTNIASFVFDLEKNQQIELGQLFERDQYLDKISNLVKEELLVILGPEADQGWISEGTSPLKTNFSNFYLSKESLYIVLSPYQVAPYAAGIISVPIPLQEINDLLKPEYKDSPNKKSSLLGLVTWGHEARSFSPCDQEKAYWISGSEDLLASLYEDNKQEKDPYTPLLMRLYGEILPNTSAGELALEYDGVFKVTEVQGAFNLSSCQGSQ